MNEKLIVSNLTKAYKANKVLNQVNLSFQRGVYGILGPNGAGKTTLLNAIAAVDTYPKGCITYNDIDSRNRQYGNNIGYVPQNFQGFKDNTVEEMLTYILTLKGVAKKQISDSIERALEDVNLKEKQRTKLSKLSGGMLRRVGIAQCIAGSSSVWIMDEPTTGLDLEERVRFREVILKYANEKIILISSHIVEDIEKVSDYVVLMKQQKLTTALSMKEFLQLPGDNQNYSAEESYLWWINQE